MFDILKHAPNVSTVHTPTSVYTTLPCQNNAKRIATSSCALHSHWTYLKIGPFGLLLSARVSDGSQAGAGPELGSVHGSR